jgi:hypothetical protein
MFDSDSKLNNSYVKYRRIKIPTGTSNSLQLMAEGIKKMLGEKEMYRLYCLKLEKQFIYQKYR